MKLFDRFRPEASGSTQEESLMFEMQQIGRRIAASRKQMDMTQQDLADQLGVTYQAVSNWERGLSIPDVLRLKDLAHLFGMSLDELMGNEEDARILEVASGDRKAQSTAELASSAPYMKPSVLERELLDQADALIPPSTEKEEKQAESPRETIIPIATPPKPSAPTQPISPAGTADAEGSENNRTQEGPGSTASRIALEDLMAMAPFVSPEVLTKVLRRLITSEADFPTDKISVLAPFLEPDQLKDLISDALNSDRPISGELISSLAPFMDPAGLEDIVTRGLQSSNLTPQILMHLAPFMDSDGLDRIIRGSGEQSSELPDNVIRSLAPFLDSETISHLISRKEDFSSELIRSLMPFAEEADIDAMLLRSFDKD